MKYLLLMFLLVSSSLSAAEYVLCDPDSRDQSPVEDITFVFNHSKTKRIKAIEEYIREGCESKGWKFVAETETDRHTSVEKLQTLCIIAKHLEDAESRYVYFDDHDVMWFSSRNNSRCSSLVTYSLEATALRKFLAKQIELP